MHMAKRNERKIIIVPGHGVCKRGCTTPELAPLDESWVGIFRGEGPFYIEHACEGVLRAADSPDAILVFSGGQTREAAGPRSEAESYFEIAADAGWWGHSDVYHRALKEEYARDSFENLLFSLALFLRETGEIPEHVTVVGWKFKERRFDLHRQALKWPRNRFTYVGKNNPVDAELQKAEAGEKAKLEAVQRDLFLVGLEWVAQRELRDPFRRRHLYRGVDAGLDTLFDFLDSHAYNGDLPW